MLVTTTSYPASDLQRKPASWPIKSQFHWSTGRCWWPVVYNGHQLLSTHFSHGLAIQVELVAAVAKGPSLRVLFHGLDTSRRSAFQSSAEACYMQLRGPRGAPVKLQYSMSGPLVSCNPGLPGPGFPQMENTSCRRRKLSLHCKHLEVLG